MPKENSTPTSMSRAVWQGSQHLLVVNEAVGNLPIFTTLLNCTDFSAAVCRSSIEKIFNPDSLICLRQHSLSPPIHFSKGNTDQLRGLLHVCTLQPRHDRRPQIHSLHHTDQPLRNSIAPYYTAEDIHKYGRNFRIACNEVEGLLNGLRCGASTNIKKVGWLSAVQLDDVHCCHCKAGAVDEAADITVELDEVETGS